MKIGIVTPYFFPLYGGVQEHILQIYKNLKKNYPVEVKIITSHFLFSPTSEVNNLEDIEKDTIRLGYAIGVPSNGSVGQVTIPYIGLKNSIKKVLIDEKIEILHIHEPLVPTLPLFALSVGVELSLPIVGTFHAYAPKNPYYILFKKYLQEKFSSISKKICVSSAVAELLSCYFYPAEFHLIPNGVDTERFSYCEEEREKDVILFVGRLEPRKGLQFLIDALYLLKKEIKGAKLWVVGEGPLRKKYRIPKEIREDVIFFGWQYKNLPYFYRRATVFCAPAIGNESFGMILLEAQACGLPVVASNIPGYNEVIKDNYNGILVPPKSKEALALALKKLIKDKNLACKFRLAGIKEAKKFSWDKITEKIWKIYQDVS